MKIIKGLRNSLILFLIIISALLFINVIPSFADPCTGGTATTDGNYTVRTFTSNGTAVCTSDVSGDIIMVGGGGGGGSNRGSGGGAGGFIGATGITITADTYTVVIGAGGYGGTNQNDNATAGANTTVAGSGGAPLVAYGGGRGRGGTAGGAYSALTGGDGASAAGGCYGGPSGSTTSSNLGHAGGGSSNSSPGYGAGGGGGAGTAGSNGTSVGGGKGGDGTSSSISGTAKYYGGGGGGGQLSTSQSNSGGQGGGGNGAGYNSAVPATAGVNGTGGGGGGGGDGGTAAYNAGAAGGSGIAIFRYLNPDGPTTHKIIASAGSNGSISPSGEVTVFAGNSQEFIITPNPGYVSNVFIDDLSIGAVSGYKFHNVTSNHTIRVTFIATHTIAASAGSNGSISPSGGVIVNSGANQAFTITPNNGYVIYDVLVDSSSVGKVSSHTFYNVTGNHTISASFVDTCTITASAGSNGSISPPGAVPVTPGANRIFNISPASGYMVSNVLVDGISVGAVTSHKFTNVIADHTISASFILAGGNYNPASGNLKYTYDDLNRLKIIDDITAGNKVEYQYDEVGNRTLKTITLPSYNYTVTFDSQGADVAANPTSKTVTSPATTVGTLPTSPSKAGYSFGGWYTAINGGGTQFTVSTTVAANITVYAKWDSHVSIGGTYYASLQSAYNAASTGATIKVKAINFTENLNVNRDISVNIEGGYDDNYSTVTGNTTLKGVVQTYAGGGTITIKNFILQN